MAAKPKNGLFVTGTDTEVGKTYVSSLIVAALLRRGVSVGVYKPVASGCVRRGDALVSEDAEQLWAAAGNPKTLHEVTPQRFEAALAPNVAARLAEQSVDAELIRSGLDAWSESEFVLIEGVGGLLAPMTDDELVVDVAGKFGYPLLVVVGNKLGCINHALLTLEVAKQRGFDVAGIVLNDVEQPDESAAWNRDEIERLSGSVVLAHVKHGEVNIELTQQAIKKITGVT